MDKISQKNLIADMAQANGYKLTLGQLLVQPLAAEYRRANDELRKEGWIITVKQNYKERRKNVYTYIPPESDRKHVSEGKPKDTQRGLESGLVQVGCPCSVCGSYYQRNGECNVCE